MRTTATSPTLRRTGESATIGIGLVIGIVLVAANLRATLTGVGPLLPMISRDTGLSSTAAGLLNTLPLLAFAATSPLVPGWARKRGNVPMLALGLSILVVGTLLRSVPGAWALYAGTVVLAVGIAVGNVLLPAVLAGAVPKSRVSAYTSLYAMTMGLVAAISSGIAVPVATAAPGGWRTALAWWALPAGVALIVWTIRAMRLRRDRLAATADPAAGADHRDAPSPWRSPLAWQVAAFMGLQSMGFYTIVGWLPSILADSGASADTGGWLLSIMQLVALGSNALVPMLARLLPDQRLLAAGATCFNLVGFAGILLAPGLAIWWSLFLGLGSGACLVLALGFQAQRSANSTQAAMLSGMSQSVGYLIGAAGPVLVGSLHDLTGAWTVPLTLVILLTVVQAVVGIGAGRDRHYATS